MFCHSEMFNLIRTARRPDEWNEWEQTFEYIQNTPKSHCGGLGLYCHAYFITISLTEICSTKMCQQTRSRFKRTMCRRVYVHTLACVLCGGCLSGPVLRFCDRPLGFSQKFWLEMKSQLKHLGHSESFTHTQIRAPITLWQTTASLLISPNADNLIHPRTVCWYYFKR